MLLKIPKMATREREETYKIAKEIMDKLEETPWKSRSAEGTEIEDWWDISDYKRDNEEYGTEEQTLTCPYCFASISAWSDDELQSKMKSHINKCKGNPKNKPKEEVKINIEKKSGLPIWAL